MKKIMTFTKQDFLETDKPYRYIEEVPANSLERVQIETMVRENAKKVGITNFTALNKAYRSSKLA